MDDIKTYEDLKKVLNSLEQQGFGSFYADVFHRKKVDKIINNENKLNIDYEKQNKNLKSSLYDLTNYEEIKKQAANFFSKYSPDDKILEIVQSFFPKPDVEIESPGRSDSNKDVIEWVKFRIKYNLKDNEKYISSKYLNLYNLDKNIIKIHFRQYDVWEFRQLYKLLFNEECKDFNSDKITGEWIDLNKIQIKFYANGNTDIKGDLTKLKEYYFKYLTDKIYRNLIIIYNKEKHIFYYKEK